MPVEEARPLPGTIALRKVVMRLFRDPVVPIVDDYCCTVKPAVRYFLIFFEQLFSNRLISLFS